MIEPITYFWWTHLTAISLAASDHGFCFESRSDKSKKSRGLWSRFRGIWRRGGTGNRSKRSDSYEISQTDGIENLAINIGSEVTADTSNPLLPNQVNLISDSVATQSAHSGDEKSPQKAPAQPEPSYHQLVRNERNIVITFHLKGPHSMPFIITVLFVLYSLDKLTVKIVSVCCVERQGIVSRDYTRCQKRRRMPKRSREAQEKWKCFERVRLRMEMMVANEQIAINSIRAKQQRLAKAKAKIVVHRRLIMSRMGRIQRQAMLHGHRVVPRWTACWSSTANRWRRTRPVPTSHWNTYLRPWACVLIIVLKTITMMWPCIVSPMASLPSSDVFRKENSSFSVR